jgi:hypothetical protein
MEYAREKKEPEERAHPSENIGPGKPGGEQGQEKNGPEQREGRESLDEESDDHQKKQGDELGPGVQPVKKGIPGHILSKSDVLQELH